MKQRILNISLPLAIAVAAWFGYAYFDAAKEAKSYRKLYASASKDIKTQATIIYKYRDSSGNEHARINPNENLINKELAKTSKNLDTIALNAGVKKSEVTSYIGVEATVSAKNLPAKQDTIIPERVYFIDRTFNLAYTPGLNNRPGLFDVSANIYPNITTYRKKKYR